MILKHQAISLRTITRSDISQIRVWRNQRSVNRYLVNSGQISEQEQDIWFENIDYSTSIYFMIEEAGIGLGIIYARNINVANKSFEGNIFMGNPDNVNMQLPIKAGLMLTNFFFDHLSFDTSYSRVHHQNKAALDLDRYFGFKELRTEGDFIISMCDKQDFENQTARLRKLLLRDQPVETIIEEGDEKFSFLHRYHCF